MGTVAEKSVFQIVDEMDNTTKDNIIETCVSSEEFIDDALNSRFGLKEWFDTYICSGEFADLSVERKKIAVKTFREIHSLLEILSINMR